MHVDEEILELLNYPHAKPDFLASTVQSDQGVLLSSFHSDEPLSRTTLFTTSTFGQLYH